MKTMVIQPLPTPQEMERDVLAFSNPENSDADRLLMGKKLLITYGNAVIDDVLDPLKTAKLFNKSDMFKEGLMLLLDFTDDRDVLKTCIEIMGDPEENGSVRATARSVVRTIIDCIWDKAERINTYKTFPVQSKPLGSSRRKASPT